MANRATTPPRRTPLAVLPATGTATALALLAFTADHVDGIGGHVMVALTSSGFAWGLAALLTGHHARNPRHAAATATTVLVTATLGYYLLIVLVSRRWSGGSSGDLHGLLNVAIMTTIWLTGSLVAGPLLGLLGHAIRPSPNDSTPDTPRTTTPTTTPAHLQRCFGSEVEPPRGTEASGPPRRIMGTRRAAVAAGVAYGLLSGEGWYRMPTVSPWDLPSGAGDEAEFFRGSRSPPSCGWCCPSPYSSGWSSPVASGGTGRFC
ncbi:hypothetical protein [Actinoplanes sp. NPDC048796]|uniref:hypothetical protein n=1 Tax=Actinoplanes sp. NPDC048796 TaxID=3155640 RepID=UPI0033F175A2